MPDLDPADPPRVVPLTVVDRRRPDPPPEMPEREAELWRAIVNSRRPGWIDNPGSALVLELYCHAGADPTGTGAGLLTACRTFHCQGCPRARWWSPTLSARPLPPRLREKPLARVYCCASHTGPTTWTQ
jgi:hypothetical protein